MADEYYKMQKVISIMAKAKGVVKRELIKHIKKIFNEGQKFGYLGSKFTFKADKDLDAKVTYILENLRDEIMKDIDNKARESASVSGDKDDDVLIFIRRPIGKEDMAQRIDKHLLSFRNILEGWVSIKFAEHLSTERIINNIFAYMDNPEFSPIWQKAKKDGNYKAESITALGMVGKGNNRNVLKALTLIAKTAISEAFHYSELKRFMNMDAIGYRTHRASSYPCQHCDELTMTIHPLSEMVLPAHPNCVCYATPVLLSDII